MRLFKRLLCKLLGHKRAWIGDDISDWVCKRCGIQGRHTVRYDPVWWATEECIGRSPYTKLEPRKKDAEH